jgi:hypothetical protein
MPLWKEISGGLYWHSRRFSEGPKRKYYDLVRSVTQLLSTCLRFIKRYAYIKLVLGTLFSEWLDSNIIYREKCNDILQKLEKSNNIRSLKERVKAAKELIKELPSSDVTRPTKKIVVKICKTLYVLSYNHI